MSLMLRKQYKLILLVLLTAGLFFFFHGMYSCFRAMDSASWPFIEGEIVKSHISKSKSESNIKYKAYVEYRYRIENQEYTGNKIGFASLVTEEYANEVTQRYKVGNKANVFYNPNDFEDAILEPGITLLLILYPAMGVFFVVLSSVLLYFREKMLDFSEDLYKKLVKFRAK